MPKPSITAKTFWTHVDVRDSDECWPWLRACYDSGYGSLRSVHFINPDGTYMRRAHRVAYFLSKGPIPDNLIVLHSCDNPLCCNPAHLSLGTNADNSRQSVDRLRHRNVRKTHCPRGHLYDKVKIDGSRVCSECSRIQGKLFYTRNADRINALARKRWADGYRPNRERGNK